MPEGLCAELEETFATMFWKAENQQALTCITQNCRPGLDLGFTVHQSWFCRCEGVEISDDDPQVWSPDIKAESEDVYNEQTIGHNVRLQ